MARMKQLCSDLTKNSCMSEQETGRTILVKHCVQPTRGNTDTKSLISHSKAAVGSSDVMEVDVSHLTLFTDLRVEFSAPWESTGLRHIRRKLSSKMAA